MEVGKSFEITVGDYDLSLRLGNCACVLFRSHQEMDYLAVDLEDVEDNKLRVFNNPEFTRWVAGYELRVQDNTIHRPSLRRTDASGVYQSFRELTGWNPPVIEKEMPAENELEMYLEVNSDDLETGLDELLGGGE